MASLIDLLIDDLNNEDTGYNKLLDLSNDKTSAIVKGDVDELQKIFLQEQKLIEELETVEQKMAAVQKCQMRKGARSDDASIRSMGEKWVG